MNATWTSTITDVGIDTSRGLLLVGDCDGRLALLRISDGEVVASRSFSPNATLHCHGPMHWVVSTPGYVRVLDDVLDEDMVVAATPPCTAAYGADYAVGDATGAVIRANVVDGSVTGMCSLASPCAALVHADGCWIALGRHGDCAAVSQHGVVSALTLPSEVRCASPAGTSIVVACARELVVVAIQHGTALSVVHTLSETFDALQTWRNSSSWVLKAYTTTSCVGFCVDPRGSLRRTGAQENHWAGVRHSPNADRIVSCGFRDTTLRVISHSCDDATAVAATTALSVFACDAHEGLALLVAASAISLAAVAARRDPPLARTVRSPFSMDASCDTADLRADYQRMQIFVCAKLVGDSKPAHRFVAIGSTAAARDVVECVEGVFDRRLAVSFVTSSGKLLELTHATQRIFAATPDADKSLICRPLFPGVSLSRDAREVACTNTDASGHAPTGVIKLRRDQQKAMAQRLHSAAARAKERSVLRLTQTTYPEGERVKLSKTTERGLVARLGGPEAVGRKLRVSERIKQLCIQDGTIVEAPRGKSDLSAAEFSQKFHDERCASASKFRERLEAKLFVPPSSSTPTLTSAGALSEWTLRMGRPIRSTLRLPKDMVY